MYIMANTNLRIVNDIMDFNKNRPDDIYINFDKKNIKKIYSLIIGPSSTPYYGGNFFFEINFPENYPQSSPKVKFLTTDGKVRFNPNLYACGKVCLSILGTWAGPKWEPVMTLKSVLLSIQSLMCENPLRNEPGYDCIHSSDTKALQYTQYVIYNTYKIGIMMVINSSLSYNVNLLELFRTEIMDNLKKNYNNLKNDLLSYAEIYGSTPLMASSIGYNISMKELDFIKLCYNFIEEVKV
jgi:ubiquitin-protein ligase